MNFGSDANSPAAKLSERQRQCLELVAQNRTSKEIGRALGLSPSTVDNHIAAAMERLGTTSRTEAARFVDVSRDEERLAPSTRLAGLLPPLGGRPNGTPVAQRYLQVFQVATLGLMSMAMLTLTVAGIVRLLVP